MTGYIDRAYIEIHKTKKKHIVLYDYNTIVTKHFVSEEARVKEKIRITHSFP